MLYPGVTEVNVEMQTVVFLVDNSASMNQKCYLGTTLLDVAKSAVETFVKQRCNRTDKYMLVTLDEGNSAIKSGWKDSQNHASTLNKLKNVVADGVTTLGHALKLCFDLLSINRHLSGIDTYGHGRSPFYLEPSIVIAITDGGKLSNRSAVYDELHLPMSNLLPGSELTKEPFRWDQRLFSLVLRLPANATLEPEQLGSVPTDPSPISLMCEVTGGRSYCIKTQKTLLQCLDSLVQKVQSGVVVHFDKADRGKDSKEVAGNIDNRTIVAESLPWHSLHRMIYVRPSPKSGMPVGHWPLPESYHPDQNAPTLPPRNAHPMLKFTCENVEPYLLTNFPYDKYELEPSPLTQVLLEQKNSNICWQVYVENSGKQSNVCHPCGYLKASSSLTSVNLFVMPYNYPVLLRMVDQLIKQKVKPTPEWRRCFEDYLKTVPHYYITPLRKAFRQIGAHNLIPESYGIGLSYSVNVYLKKLKEQTKVVADRFNNLGSDNTNVRQNVLLKFRSKSFSVAAQCNFHKLVSDMVDHGAAYKRIEVEEFAGFQLGDHYKQPILPREFHNAFDIPRYKLLTQIKNMRLNFKQIVQSSFSAAAGDFAEQLANTLRIRLQDRAEVHSQPISQMGNYQDYVKNLPVPLREANPDTPRRLHTFGNPFKMAKEKGIMIDETEDYDGPSASSPSSKRKVSVGHSGLPTKRRRSSSPYPKFTHDVKAISRDKKGLKAYIKNEEPPVPKVEEKVVDLTADTEPKPEQAHATAEKVQSLESTGTDVVSDKDAQNSSVSCIKKGVISDNVATDIKDASASQEEVEFACMEIVKLIRKPGKHTKEVMSLLSKTNIEIGQKSVILEQLINEAHRFKRKDIISVFQGQSANKV